MSQILLIQQKLTLLERHLLSLDTLNPLLKDIPIRQLKIIPFQILEMLKMQSKALYQLFSQMSLNTHKIA